jgi:formylglycine-generating enzyme required for sulfatase activity
LKWATASKNKTELSRFVVSANSGSTHLRFKLYMQLLFHRKKHTAQFFTEKLSDTISLDMMLIPGGTFMMGSPESELEREEDEFQHPVTVPTFCMGKYPITQAQWRVVANLLPEVNLKLNIDPSDFPDNDHPVENISWFEATEFCARLSNFTKREYQLPSEAQWEYACRADTTTPFHFGETISTDIVNYNDSNSFNNDDLDNSNFFEVIGGLGKTTAVESFSPNAFGLYNMHGNVWEWCLDHYQSNYGKAPMDGSAWINPETVQDDYRVLLGGSWYNVPHCCRSAARFDFGLPGIHFNYIGFRVVCVAAKTS